MARQLDKAMGKMTDHERWQVSGLFERLWVSDTPPRGQEAAGGGRTFSSLF